jgi:peptidyl-tRNA hydrolase
LADFVLSPFDAEEKGVVEEMIKNAAGKVEEFVRSSNGSTQGHF